MDAEAPGIIRDETGAQTLIGYVLDVSQRDADGKAYARCWLDIEPKHLNRHEALHGGLIASMLDNACGATASLTADESGKAPFMTVSFNTHFLEGVKSGRVTAQGRVRRAGRSLVAIDGEMFADDGRLIATGSGVFKRVPPQRLGTAPANTQEGSNG